jgi:hypothetical protein
MSALCTPNKQLDRTVTGHVAGATCWLGGVITPFSGAGLWFAGVLVAIFVIDLVTYGRLD